MSPALWTLEHISQIISASVIIHIIVTFLFEKLLQLLEHWQFLWKHFVLLGNKSIYEYINFPEQYRKLSPMGWGFDWASPNS